MTHPTIAAAIRAGILEPCVILDGDGRELHGYRPSEFGQRFFGPEPHSEPVDVSNILFLHEHRGAR